VGKSEQSRTSEARGDVHVVDLVGCRREKESRNTTNNTRTEYKPNITMASMPPLRVRKATATMGYIPDGKSVDNKK
jgi:hypothetical protein